MPNRRRLTAALVSASLGWAVLALGVASPAAQAEGTPAVSSAPASSAVVEREPHDPATYYASALGLSGNALALQLNSIIDGNTFLPYTSSSSTDVWDALKVLDQDPSNPNRVIDAYSGDSLDAANQCGSSCALDGWNREHTWAQSRGSFNTAAGPGTDLFHMRPLRGNTNSSRGNKDFDNGGTSAVPGCPICKSDGDSFEPRDSFKGDLARGLFYMDVRFNGDTDDGYGLDLRMWDTVGSSGSQIGKLSTLVAWSLLDPPDAGEKNRNDLVDDLYQHNRNPFIDHPEWVCSIWGSQVPAAACANNNTAPSTAPMTKTIAEDSGPTTVALAANDADGDNLTWSLSTPSAAHGTASIAGSTLTYTPAANFNGQDVVGVSVSDGKGGTAATTVTITISPVNDAPVASNVSATAPRNTSTQIDLVGSDAEDTDLVFTVATQPAHGSVTVSGRTATYTPTTGYTGADSFTYTVRDTAGATSAPATVSITVTASTNNAPVTTSGTATTAENTATTVTLSATDADGDALTYTITGPPAHGSVTLAGTQATYTPATDYFGPDSFTWEVTDGQATATGTTTVTVTEVTNQAPTITGTTLHTTPGAPVTVTLADLGATDLDGDTVTITGVSAPTLGTVAPSTTAVTYTPGARWGTDTFVVRVTDGQGGTAAATVTVDIAAQTAQLQVSAPTSTRGTRGTVTITATGTDGTTPTGTVTLKSGDTVLAEPTLGSDGTATVSFTPARAGMVPLVARYDGDNRYGPTTSAPATWTVTRSAAKLSTSAGTLKRGKAGVVKATVRTVAGVPATGKVTLTVGGKKLTAKLVKGVATFKIAKLPRTAQLKVVARYAGDTQYVAGTASHTYPLKK